MFVDKKIAGELKKQAEILNDLASKIRKQKETSDFAHDAQKDLGSLGKIERFEQSHRHDVQCGDFYE